MKLGYRVLSTVGLALPRRERVWLDPGVPHPIGIGAALVCYFDRQIYGRSDPGPFPSMDDYLIRVDYDSPRLGCSFSYEDVGTSFVMQDAWLTGVPRVVESPPYGPPIRILFDFYPLDAFLSRSVSV